MEIRTGKYGNFILTVIAVLLLALLIQGTFDLTPSVQAQPEAQPMTISPEMAMAQGLQSIATGVRDVADALRDVAGSNQRIATAIQGIGSLEPAAAR